MNDTPASPHVKHAKLIYSPYPRKPPQAPAHPSKSQAIISPYIQYYHHIPPRGTHNNFFRIPAIADLLNSIETIITYIMIDAKQTIINKLAFRSAPASIIKQFIFTVTRMISLIVPRATK